MKLHPVILILIIIEICAMTVFLPLWHGLITFLILFPISVIIPSRTGVDTSGIFIKLLFVAAFFLLLINGIKWVPPGIDYQGLDRAINSFVNIGACFLFIIFVTKTISAEELFALMTGVKIPSPIILIFFRTAWLVPRFSERVGEVLTAQRLRGMKTGNIFERAGAVLPSLNPILSTMLQEIAQNALVITSRGFLNAGRKSSRLVLHMTLIDYLFLFLSTLIMVSLIVIF